MKCVDVFDKYYSFNRSRTDNKYYGLKKDNYERVRSSYQNGDIDLRAFPIRATIQTTECCNLNCIMCQIHSRRPKRKLLSMKKSDFDEIAKQLFPYLVEVHPTNIGEPMLSEWFDYFCDKAFEYGVLLDITTNGTRLDEGKVRRILRNLLDIKISFDGIKKETFERIRKNANYDAVVNNIKNLLRIRESEDATGMVTLQMTLFDFNFRELPDVIRFAKEFGIDGVKAYHVFSYFDDIDKRSPFNDLDMFEETRISSIALAEELGVRLEISEPGVGNVKNLIRQKCRLPWGECWVDHDGEVYPCHSHACVSLGNIITSNLRTIWNGDYAKNLRASLVTTDTNAHAHIDTICNGCGMNFIKHDENQPVPYDKSGYMYRSDGAEGSIRWSGRSKQFLLRR